MIVDWSERDIDILRQMVRWYQTQGVRQRAPVSQFIDNEFCRLFMTPADGIPARTGTGPAVEGTVCGSAECQLVRINPDTAELELVEDQFATVYHYGNAAVLGDRIITAWRDPWSSWVYHDQRIAIPLDLTQTGGSQGTGTTKASWTYSVYNALDRGNSPTALLTATDPTSSPHQWVRHNGQMEKADFGWGYYNVDGNLEITWINEILISEVCS